MEEPLQKINLIFPPPIDNELYFGNVAIIAHKDKLLLNNVINFSVDDWCKVYEKLMGGFIDLGEEDTASEEEEDIPLDQLTKQGYHKDGFIITDDEGDIESEKSYEEEKELDSSEELGSNEYESGKENEEKWNSDVEENRVVGRRK